MKKLKFLFLIMLATFMSLLNVNASEYNTNDNGYGVDLVFNGIEPIYWSNIGANSTKNVTFNEKNNIWLSSDFQTYSFFNIVIGTSYVDTIVSVNGYDSPFNTGDYTLACNTYNSENKICILQISVNHKNGLWQNIDGNGAVEIDSPRMTFTNNASWTIPLNFYGGYFTNEVLDYSSLEISSSTQIIKAMIEGLITSNSGIVDSIVNSSTKVEESVNDLNDNITNDDVGGVQNSFESFEGFIAENSTITQLITMPITLYSSILNGIQSTCQPFNLGNLFGTNLTIPCINIGNYLGNSLWSMIDIIISGFSIFAISKKLIKIFNNFSSMKEGDVIDD